MGVDATTGERIRQYRKEKGLTQGELGEKLGLTASAVMRYERGQRKVSVDLLRRIADVLEVDPYSLTDWDDATELIDEESKRSAERKEKIYTDLDKLTLKGLDLAADLICAIAGNPEYRMMTDEELRKEQDGTEK